MANSPLVFPRSDPPSRGADEPGPNKPELHSIGGLRSKLFYEPYGILENPFGVTPEPRYLYQSRSHAEARAALIIGIECGLGFQALIAPPGMGKTTILFDLLQRFNKVALTAFLFHNHGDSRDFLRDLISELGGETHDSDLACMQDTINCLLMREHRAGRQTIIIIDEAQNLTPSVLETVRLLSNFETPAAKLVQIILAGQPQLAQRLTSPELTQLCQRICILTTLVPFDLEDTMDYIHHRLKIAGYQGPPLFTSAALSLIWERSGGIPRKINTLCFNALLLAGATEHKQVDSDILLEIVQDLDLDRIWLDTGAPAGVVRGLQTDRPMPGNAGRDAPATSLQNGCIAAVPAAEMEAQSTFTSAFASDLARLRTIAAEIVSTSSAKNVEQPPIPRARAESHDVEQPPIPRARAESHDIVDCVFLPDRPALASDCKTDKVGFAGGALAGAPRPETEGTGASGDPLQVFLALAVEAVRTSGAKNDLSSGFESEISFSTGIKPDPKIEIKPESGPSTESHPDVEQGFAAAVVRRKVLAGKGEAAQQSLSKIATEPFKWPNQHWEAHRGIIFLGTSMLIFLLVLSYSVWIPQRSSASNLTMFRELLSSVGLTAPPTNRVPYDYPNVGVWVDLHTGLYYCAGAPMYGKTPGGKITPQRQARQEQYKTANGRVCQ